MKNVCLHLNRPKKVIWGNFCTLKVLLDSFVRIGPIRTYWAEIEKSGHICHYSHVLGSISRNLTTFCENVCLHLNRPKKVISGNFCLLMALWDSFVRIGPIRTYWAEIEKSGHICHYSYVLGWISRNLATFCENVCLHLNRPKKVICCNFCTLKVLLDSFVRIGPIRNVLGRDRKKWTYMPLFVRTGLN